MAKRLLSSAFTILLLISAGCSGFIGDSGYIRVTTVTEVPDGAVVVDSSNETVSDSEILQKAFKEGQNGSTTIQLDSPETNRVDETLSKLPYFNGSEGPGWYIDYRGTIFRISFGRDA